MPGDGVVCQWVQVEKGGVGIGLVKSNKLILGLKKVVMTVLLV